jgi:pre-mRNA-processing factor 19
MVGRSRPPAKPRLRPHVASSQPRLSIFWLNPPIDPLHLAPRSICCAPVRTSPYPVFSIAQLTRAVSGEPPQVPVASRKTGTSTTGHTQHLTISGAVYEKRLIEAYIADHGSEPTTDEPLTLDDLLPLQSGPTLVPADPSAAAEAAARPPTQTSVPALLATFQSEWDALALETFELRRALARSRQELSVALYDYEGALRVLARTARERDEARRALASVRADGASAAGAAEDMDVDAADVEVPEEIVKRVESTKKKYCWMPCCGDTLTRTG